MVLWKEKREGRGRNEGKWKEFRWRVNFI